MKLQLCNISVRSNALRINSYLTNEYGVVARSVLMDTPYFNVTRQMPLDIMHMMLDGALSRALYFVLKWFLDNSIYSG